MGGMEFNKILAALLVAGIIAMFSGFIAKQLTKPEHLAEHAYAIEAAESDFASGPAKEKMAEPILALLAAADVAKGQKISKACASCHTFDQGGANGVGPNMYGIVGRNKQSVAGFTYSGSLTEQGGTVWTYAELNKFLWNPKKYAPATKMGYAGLKKPEDRAALIAWMRTLSPSPKALPSAGEIAAEAVVAEPAESPVAEAMEAVEDSVEKTIKSAEDKIVEEVKEVKEVKEEVKALAH